MTTNAPRPRPDKEWVKKQRELLPPPPPPPPYKHDSCPVNCPKKIQITVVVNSDKIDGKFNLKG